MQTPRAAHGYLDPLPVGEAFTIPGLDPELGLQGLMLRAEDLSEEQERELIELLSLGFNGGPHWFSYDVEPVEHLRWKYRDTPDAGEYFFLVRDGAIKRTSSTVLRRVRLNGQPRMLNDGGDMVLHPDLQGRRIDRFVSEYRDQRPRAGLDMQLRVLTHPAHLRRVEEDPLWRRIANPLRLYARPLDLRRLAAIEVEAGGGAAGPSRTARSVRSGWKARLATSATLRRMDWQRRIVQNSLRRRGRGSGTATRTISDLERFDERFDELFEEVAPGFDFIRVRDAAYLNWRFADPRAGAFRVRVAEEEGRVLGYAALAPSAGYIADLLVRPGRDDALHGLLSDAARLVEAAGAPVVQTWLPERHVYRAALHNAGFVIGRRGQAPLLASGAVAVPHEEMRPFADPNGRIHFMPADSDHV